MTEPTDAELTAIYKAANGEDTGKAQPLTTQRIFRAMRAAIAKWGVQQPVAPIHDLGFIIEKRAGVDVLAWDKGGCRPAASTEIAMWHSLAAAPQPVAPDEDTAMNRTRDLAESGRWPSDWVEAYRRGYSDRAARASADSVLEDAERYRFLAGNCRSTSEHWGGRWSIIVEGPAPKSHDSEDDFDEAVDAALAAQKGGA